MSERQLSATQPKRYRPDVERFWLIVNLHLTRWDQSHIDDLCYEQRSELIEDLSPFYSHTSAGSPALFFCLHPSC
jgi:hypothetical protein